ncbi:hypothetical protein P152DRAFT_14643 [Eremomyces bilateralis CBS 781.70]|uniref:Uncharacterized protein n=1 Tax=Eremomyces bilateralis CBS 781.70 TaxID=1392243 RepID=A0A6G1GH08_9PEZI|nr:uncharacterized protein P152DRAFT_14643 [Eremomyces bilateralis CBS 781.70]KAF1817294.1 hypothetical protein P152DRAFT_14643 [Eremomyces bilateralis CBS 781.70]
MVILNTSISVRPPDGLVSKRWSILMLSVPFISRPSGKKSISMITSPFTTITPHINLVVARGALSML